MNRPDPAAAPADASQKPSRRGWLKLVLIAGVVCMVGLGVALWWCLRPIHPVELSAQEQAAVEAKLDRLKAPQYEKGSQQIVLTQREVNGLINQNTEWGDRLKLEFARDAIHARIETDLDPDIPIVGGKRLKLRARFLVAGNREDSHIILDDVTLWGISLPNDWLGGLKGKNLLQEALGFKNRGVSGVEKVSIEPGELIIRLAD